MYFHWLFVSVFLFLPPVPLSPFVSVQVHPRCPLWPLSFLRRAGSSRSMLSSAFPFGPCERTGCGTSFLWLWSLCLQHFSCSWGQSQELQSVHSPERPLTIVPDSVTLGSWALGSTLSVSGLWCFSLMFPTAFISDTVQLLLSAGKIFMAFYIWNALCSQGLAGA